jgi:hypothetical protein
MYLDRFTASEVARVTLAHGSEISAPSNRPVPYNPAASLGTGPPCSAF